MAISVLSGSPQFATPAYNKMIFKVSGSLTSATNYRYVCDVKNSAGTTLARLKCDKLPNTNYGFFDVSRVVETLIAPQMPSRAEKDIFYDHAGFYAGYQLTFMEEYGSTPVVYTGTTTNVTGNFVFAGNLDQIQFDQWDSNRAAYFNAASGRVQALTLAASFTNVTTGFTAAEIRNALKNTPNVTNRDMAASTAFASPTNDYWTEARILYYDRNGNITRNYSINNTTTSGSVYKIVRFGTGGRNISTINSAFTSDSQPGSNLFPTDEGAGYSVHFERSGFISQPIFYRIGPCRRFDTVELSFINRFGGVDSFEFTLKNRMRVNVERDTFGYNSDVYATNTYDKVWAGNYQQILTLNSDWLTDSQSALLVDLIKTSQAEIFYTTPDEYSPSTQQFGTAQAPAIVNANQYQFVTRRNDRLQQLQIEVAVAYKNNIL